MIRRLGGRNDRVFGPVFAGSKVKRGQSQMITITGCLSIDVERDSHCAFSNVTSLFVDVGLDGDVLVA
jgi:hypothetical protein